VGCQIECKPVSRIANPGVAGGKNNGGRMKNCFVPRRLSEISKLGADVILQPNLLEV